MELDTSTGRIIPNGGLALKALGSTLCLLTPFGCITIWKNEGDICLQKKEYMLRFNEIINKLGLVRLMRGKTPRPVFVVTKDFPLAIVPCSEFRGEPAYPRDWSFDEKCLRLNKETGTHIPKVCFSNCGSLDKGNESFGLIWSLVKPIEESENKTVEHKKNKKCSRKKKKKRR